MGRDPHSCSLAHRTARGLVTACVRERRRKPGVCGPLWWRYYAIVFEVMKRWMASLAWS